MSREEGMRTVLFPTVTLKRRRILDQAIRNQCVAWGWTPQSLLTLMAFASPLEWRLVELLLAIRGEFARLWAAE